MVKEISAEDLEAACAKKQRVTVSDITAFSKALEMLHLQYQIISETEVDIFDEITVSELTDAANTYDCKILKVKELDESLESYYLNLIGGGAHA